MAPERRITSDEVIEMTVGEAIKLLDDQPEPRLIVLDEDGATLRGRLCFNPGSREFCVR